MLVLGSVDGVRVPLLHAGYPESVQSGSDFAVALALKPYARQSYPSLKIAAVEITWKEEAGFPTELLAETDREESNEEAYVEFHTFGSGSFVGEAVVLLDGIGDVAVTVDIPLWITAYPSDIVIDIGDDTHCGNSSEETPERELAVA